VIQAIGPAADGDDNAHESGQLKRLRRNKDVPEYDAELDQHILERMGRSIPMNWENLKRMQRGKGSGALAVEGEERGGRGERNGYG